MKPKRLSLCVLSLLLALATLFPLASCGPRSAGTPTETAAVTTAATTEAPQKYTIRLRELGESVSIHTDPQTAYLANADPHSILTYANATAEASRPEPIRLRWAISESAAGHVRLYVVRIWTKPDRSDVTEATVAGSKTEYAFYNAMLGTTYYWNVSSRDDEDDISTSETSSFTTESQGPRNLYVDGVTNVRDLGGWATVDGGRIRQGLLYRGGRFSSNESTSVTISAKGILTLRDEIGIKTEIDLRQTTAVNNRNESGGLTASPLGDSVRYCAFPMEYGEVLFSDPKNIQRIREIFAFLSDESNYPIYFHCSIGTDRTGLIAWLVNGLCGVSENDLWRDYLFSDFGQIESNPANARTRAKNENIYVNQLKNYAQGDTLAEKIYNYLKNEIGVAETDLQAVIRIMKETPNAN